MILSSLKRLACKVHSTSGQGKWRAEMETGKQQGALAKDVGGLGGDEVEWWFCMTERWWSG